MKIVAEWHRRHGSPRTVGPVTVTPSSRILRLDWPEGGLVWQGPAGIRVEDQEGSREVPIPDITRLAQLALYGASLVMVMTALFLALRR